jgi:hypothetical protein
MKRIILAVAALTALCASPAAAQKGQTSANYGEITLAPGFTPDPGLVNLRAGGSTSASYLSSGCSGYVTDSPDVRLNWQGDGSLSLIFSVLSKSDTTLIVRGPNGRFYCDDDSGEDNNPSLEMSPVYGLYDIWVGTYSSGDTAPAVLAVSELTSF